MDTYTLLREKIENIPLVDAHSHVLSHNIDPVEWEGPYEVTPLSRLLLDFNTQLLYTACGMSGQTVNDIMLGRVSPEEQKRILLSYRGVYSATIMQYLLQGLNRLCGTSVWTLDSESWDQLNTLLQGSRDDYPGMLDKIFRTCNLKASVLNLWARKCVPYLTTRDRTQDGDWYWFSNTVDYRSLIPYGPVLQAYSQILGMPYDTLEQYTALVEEICRWSVEEKGCRAFKSTEMYFRRLDYRHRTFEEAAACYKPERTAEEDQVLSDYQVEIICRMAAKYQVPFQIHTGSTWGRFAPTDISPEHLEPLISAHPDTTFDLLHGGDPHFGITALMGGAFSNVYINMNNMPCESSENFEFWLEFYLGKMPYTKLTLGWDLFTPEILCGAVPLTRNSIARVLAKKVDTGLYSLELALEVAENIMYRNAERLFAPKC